MITVGTQVRWPEAHPNNVFTVTEVHGTSKGRPRKARIEKSGESWEADLGTLYPATEEPTEAHWAEYLDRCPWGRR